MHYYDKAADLLKTKNGALWSVPPEATVYDALEIIASKDIGAVLVMRDSELIGVFSEREYARNVALEGRRSHQTLVSEVILMPPVTISLHTSIDEAMRLMSDHRIRHLPVLKNTTVVGMISMSDLVNWIIVGQKRTIQQLHGYISGQYDTTFVPA
jgi:signal-transduction protein with cAMP-binding, CBS, and nucleotidyltransferase domain